MNPVIRHIKYSHNLSYGPNAKLKKYAKIFLEIYLLHVFETQQWPRSVLL